MVHTAPAPTRPVRVAAPAPAPAPARRRVSVAILRLTTRLIRRGAALVLISVVAYTAVEALTYVATYPDAASRRQLATLQNNPAARMLEGIPHGVDTVGGFVAWDGGWVIALVVSVWAALTTMRLLRGDEEEGRAELLLAGPVTARRAIALQLTVVLAAALLAGAAMTVTLIACGGAAGGSLVFGAGLAGLTATFVASAAVAAQVFAMRRRAAGAATAAVGIAFLVRMVADSAGTTGWLRWATPFGWLDDLRPFAQARPLALAPLLVAPVALLAAAVALRGRRDMGAALLTESDSHRPHERLLRSPLAFAWRGTRGTLLAWVAGIGGYALMIGALLKTITDFMNHDANYRRVLATMGVDVNHAQDSYLGLMAVFLGLGVALYACWRVGAARAEESAGRLDALLARPVSRTRWLGGHVMLTLAGVVALSAASGSMMWAGAAMTGAHVAIGDGIAAAANPLSMVLAVLGLAVLSFAVVPRLTIALPASLAILSMLVQFVGPSLHWPSAVLDLSAFHHLGYVPAAPFALLPAVVMAAVGVLGIVGGIVLFERRDLAGA